MAFRDEHEAALQRARALELELERAKSDRDRAEKALLEVTGERDDLAAQVAESARKLEAAGITARDAATYRGSGAAVGLIAVMVVAVVGLGLTRTQSPPISEAPSIAVPPQRLSIPAPPKPPPLEVSSCAITSDPPGASLVSKGGELGVTPASIPFDWWRIEGDLELRLDGYRSAVLAPPRIRSSDRSRGACDRHVVLGRL
jgi:hypothetical protein